MIYCQEMFYLHTRFKNLYTQGHIKISQASLLNPPLPLEAPAVTATTVLTYPLALLYRFPTKFPRRYMPSS